MSDAQQWICEACGFLYDESEGDPDGGIPPGTKFEDIPDNWVCPVCGAHARWTSLRLDRRGSAAIPGVARR